jgi:hypothetical protein
MAQNQLFNGQFLKNADLNSSDNDSENLQEKPSQLEELDEFSDNSNRFKNLKGNSSQNNLHKVKQGLKDCKGESGLFNPLKAFNCLNDMQKE